MSNNPAVDPNPTVDPNPAVDPKLMVGLYFVIRDGKPAEVLHRTGESLGLWQSAWSLARAKPGGDVAVAAVERIDGEPLATYQVKVWTSDNDYEQATIEPLEKYFPPPPALKIQFQSWPTEVEDIAMAIFEQAAGTITPAAAFDRAQSFVDERERRRKETT
jgi:hypothetical protein